MQRAMTHAEVAAQSPGNKSPLSRCSHQDMLREGSAWKGHLRPGGLTKIFFEPPPQEHCPPFQKEKSIATLIGTNWDTNWENILLIGKRCYPGGDIRNRSAITSFICKLRSQLFNRGGGTQTCSHFDSSRISLVCCKMVHPYSMAGKSKGKDFVQAATV